MKSIVEEKRVSFKTLEQKIFAYVCELGRTITQAILENYDDELARERNKKVYRNKGKRATSIKTIYGEVEYSRRVYRTETEDGRTAHIYLLDQEMQMEKIGLISTNLAEKIAMTVTEAPYRVSADVISDTSGQCISHGGVWNMIQKLGERISKEEEYAVRQMEADQAEGRKSIGILFEEMDGVWLRMQDPRHKKAPKQEMKVFTMYEGWDADSCNRSRLVNKKMLAGMEKSSLFHQKREALIEKVYDTDEIGQRILNGDGGSWIKETYDPEAIFQLDRFHIYKEIRKKIREEAAQKRIKELLEEKKVDELLEYIQIYADSIESDDEKEKGSEKARELYQYLWNNREGLLPYQERGIELPEPGEGIVYKNMGVQENQNCTALTLRMKHHRMRWSVNGANNMAKALYRKENRELLDTIDRYTDGMVYTMQMEEIVKTLSAAKTPKKDGKGDPYVEVITRHMPLLDAKRTASRKAFERAFC